MAKLPTREALGALPSPLRSRRTLARIELPRTSPGEIVGAGVVQFGRGIAKVAEAADAIEDHELRRQAFETETRFQEFQWNQQQALADSARKVEPGQVKDFAENWTAGYVDSAKEFMKGVPDRIKPLYEQKLLRTERDLYGTATTFARNEEERVTVGDLTTLRENVHRARSRVSSTDELDAITADYERAVRSSPLSRIRQDELIEEGRRPIGLSHLDGQPPDRVKTLFDARTQPVTTEGLLRRFEGFREQAYWDKNAYRVGYGSDTVTQADGTVVPVTKDTRITREDAERDLARRSKEFAAVAASQVGEDAWAALPENVRAALTSVAYNYGSLPKSVVQAVGAGDVQQIANAVRSLPANRNRRSQEADVIGGGPGYPAALAALSDEDWRRTVDRADAQIKRDEARTAADTAEDYEWQIINAAAGKATLPARADIEGDRILTPQARNSLLVRYDSANRELVKQQRFRARFDDPGAGSFNPFDAEDRKGVDAVFRELGGDKAALAAVIQRTGMVPNSVATKMRGDLVSNDPTRVEAALQWTTGLIARNPKIFAGTTGHEEFDKAALKFQNDVEEFGFTSKEATKRYIDSLTPEYKQRVAAKIKGEDLNDIVKKKLVVDDLRSTFDDSFLGWRRNPVIAFEPKTRKAMFEDYEQLFREFYLEGGDVAEAKSLAQRQLKRVWGVTSVSGANVVMRYAPEQAPAYHGIDDISRKIADQAIAAVKEETGQDITRAQLRLSPVPGGRTSIAYWRGEPPPYLVFWRDKNNVLVHQLNPGRAFVADPVSMRQAQSTSREEAFGAEREYRDIARQPQPTIMRKEQKAVERRRRERALTDSELTD